MKDSKTPAKPLPQRTCVVCRQVKPKRELVRLVRTPEGRVEIDPSGKKAGRGAYLCRQRVCWEGTQKKGDQLANALKTRLNREDKERLLEEAATIVQGTSEKG